MKPLRMLAGAIVCAGALLTAATHAASGEPAGAPSFADVRAAYVSSEALLLDRRGVPLSEVRVNAKVRQLEWVALEDVSPALIAALIAAEDKRFYAHDGVDWPGLAVAAWDSHSRGTGRRVPPSG